jgi:exodeoxyribonuclease-1
MPERKNGLSEHGPILTPKPGDINKSKLVPTNRLELLTKANGLDHQNSHDAENDVYATIAVAKLLKQKQPQMFDYLLKMRDKKLVKELVNLDEKKPFVYSCGRFDSEHNKTTVAFPLTSGRNGNVLVYDLRYDPTEFVKLNEKEIEAKIYASWEDRKKPDFVKLPVKELQYNRAPAVAPLGVLTQNDGWNKIQLKEELVSKHLKTLLAHPDFAERLRTVFEKRQEYPKVPDPDFQIYDGFTEAPDKVKMRAVRSADESGLADLSLDFSDSRLEALLPRYKARNYSRSLTSAEREAWEEYRTQRILNGTSGQLSLEAFAKRLAEHSASKKDEKSKYMLEELQLYAESIAPIPD